MKQFWDQIDKDYFQEINQEDILHFIDSLNSQIDHHYSDKKEAVFSQNSQSASKGVLVVNKSQTPKPSHVSVFCN